jgi:hypothetical protein
MEQEAYARGIFLKDGNEIWDVIPKSKGEFANKKSRLSLQDEMLPR